VAAGRRCWTACVFTMSLGPRRSAIKAHTVATIHGLLARHVAPALERLRGAALSADMAHMAERLASVAAGFHSLQVLGSEADAASSAGEASFEDAMERRPPGAAAAPVDVRRLRVEWAAVNAELFSPQSAVTAAHVEAAAGDASLLWGLCQVIHTWIYLLRPWWCCGASAR
jgi:hypothetical protein